MQVIAKCKCKSMWWLPDSICISKFSKLGLLYAPKKQNKQTKQNKKHTERKPKIKCTNTTGNIFYAQGQQVQGAPSKKLISQLDLWTLSMIFILA